MSYNIRKLKNLFFSFSLIGVRVRKQKGTEINIPNWQKYLLAAIQAARCSKEKAEILSGKMSRKTILSASQAWNRIQTLTM